MRIVSLAPSNTEILFALGAGSSIIARTAYCDFPPQAAPIPKIGDWVSPDIGKIAALAPDLVLTSTIVQERLAERLSAEGLMVVHLAPRTLEDVFGTIGRIARLVGEEEAGRTVVSRMRAGLDLVRGSSESMDMKPRLYIEEWHDPPFVSGNWVPALARIAGADYGLAREGEYSRQVSLDEVSSYDPDRIVLSICGVKASSGLIGRREGWACLRAVKNGMVSAFDDSLLNRPGPRLVEGCRRLFISFSERTSA